MVTIKNNNIIMTRGDTLKTYVTVLDPNGDEYKPVQGDQIRFALKHDYSDSECLIYKEIPFDTQILQLDPEDTKQLNQPDIYLFDIQITMTDGTVCTFISGKLKIREEVE